MSIQALRERHAALNKEAKHLLAEKGDQVWSKEDQAKFDTLMDDSERVQRQIASHQRVMDDDAEANFKDVEYHNIDRNAKTGKPLSDSQKAINIFLRKSFKDMTTEEALLVRNTMSTTTGSQGGYGVESDIASSYLLHEAGPNGSSRRTLIHFREKGETAFLPTALASMVCKYLRELCMHSFNTWWCSQIAGLKPTAGYHQDGSRWLLDVEPHLPRLGIAREMLVRIR